MNEEPKELISVKNQSGQVIDLIRPIASIKELMEANSQMHRVIKDYLVEGVDWGYIKGIDKPVLLKPGAQKLCSSCGVSPTYAILEKEVNHAYENVIPEKYNRSSYTALGLYRYVVSCTLSTRNDVVLGCLMGSCSSLEAKYQSRPRELENTILKMAQKRAFVGATVSVFNLSDRFTEDMEDVQKEAEVVAPEQHRTTMFDPLLPTHKSWLERMMIDYHVDHNKFEEVSKKMAGKRASDLPSIIKEFIT